MYANSTDSERLPGAPEYDGETKDQGWLQEVFHMAATVMDGRRGEQPGPDRAMHQSRALGGCGHWVSTTSLQATDGPCDTCV